MKKILSVFVLLMLILSCSQVMAAGERWNCSSCGSENTTRFCTNCGEKKPEDPHWTCLCGAVNEGGFCGECGLKKEQANQIDVSTRINGKIRFGTYKGELVNGVPGGQGTFVSKDDDFIVTYAGNWERGLPSGKGFLEAESLKLHFDNLQGEYDRMGPYQGEVLNGLPEGYGTYASINEDGTKWIYEGEWSKGVMNGEGTTTFSRPDGTTDDYTGTHVNGMIKPISLVMPTKGKLELRWFSTKKCSAQMEIVNEDAKRTVESFVLKIMTVSFDKEEKYQTETITMKITPGKKTKTKEFYLEDFRNMQYLYLNIDKVYYTDGTSESNYFPELTMAGWEFEKEPDGYGR